jgi:hypothetical protein
MYSKKEDAYYLPYKDNNYKIFNLHIHSKKLNDFYNE